MQINIPNRFESLTEAFGGEIRPLIVPIDKDLTSLNQLREQCVVQNGGILAFLLGTSGVGKTTTVHSAAVNLPEFYRNVITVPPEIELRDAIAWISKNAQKNEDSKTTLLLFDGREVSDDDVGLKQFISTLNQFLRKRPDVLFCWPTTDSEWHSKIRSLAESVGGANLAPTESDIQIQGPNKSDWETILERILLQFQKTFDDIGVTRDTIAAYAAEKSTIGAFLTQVGTVISKRVAKVRVAKQLPRLIFVVTSSGDASGEANRIRRAGTQFLAPEPLLGHSPRSEPGKWWKARNENINHHLGYMISLFEARLVTITPSAVAYACLHHGEQDLISTAENAGMRTHAQNAQRTFTVTDFYRFFAGEQIPEFTSSKKGGLQPTTKTAYNELQKLSKTRHKAINGSLCQLAKTHLLNFDVVSLERPLGDDLISDAIVSNGQNEFTLEFHHLSEASCKASSIASYIMGKLRLYSVHHNLIPR